MARPATFPSDLLTCEDVWAMPDDGRRRELVDGVLIVTPAPRLIHQRVVRRLVFALSEACPPELELIFAPFDYKISDTTMLEPDIIVARKADYGPLRLERTPVLLVEVASPSTARIDSGIKRLTYESAGVPWYLIADPDEPRLTLLHHVAGRYETVASVAGSETLELAEPVVARIVPAALVAD